MLERDPKPERDTMEQSLRALDWASLRRQDGLERSGADRVDRHGVGSQRGGIQMEGILRVKFESVYHVETQDSE